MTEPTAASEIGRRPDVRNTGSGQWNSDIPARLTPRGDAGEDGGDDGAHGVARERPERRRAAAFPPARVRVSWEQETERVRARERVSKEGGEMGTSPSILSAHGERSRSWHGAVGGRLASDRKSVV